MGLMVAGCKHTTPDVRWHMRTRRHAKPGCCSDPVDSRASRRHPYPAHVPMFMREQIFPSPPVIVI